MSDFCDNHCTWLNHHPDCDKAEQPAQSTADKSELEIVPANGSLLPAQEPVGEVIGTNEYAGFGQIKHTKTIEWRGEPQPVGTKLYTTPQAHQKPCGWQFFQDGKWHNGMETNNHRANTEAAGVPVRDVYPSPQAQPARKWVGLTAEELDLVWDSVPETQFWWRHYAQAIENKLQEKNA